MHSYFLFYSKSNKKVMIKTSKLFIALTTLCFCSNLFSASYYVASNGSDSNLGSEQLPWLTIQHAADIAVAGDLVYIKSGEYNERIKSKKSGSSSAGKITFISFPRRTATLRGFDVSHDFIRIEGFQITNDISGKAEDGITSSGSNNEIVDNYLFNIKKTAIYSSGDNSYIADNRIYKSQMGIVTSGINWLVEKNEVERMYMYGTMGDCDYSRFFGENGISRKNFFHGSTAAETDPAHLDCFQTFDDGINPMKNITIEDNICFDCDQGIMAEGHFAKVSTNLLVKNNVFAHTLAWGVCSEDIDRVQVINNTFYDIRVHGVGLSGSYGTNGIIKNNIFMNINERAYMTGGGSNVGDYNLVFNCWKPIPEGRHDIVNVKDPLFVNAENNDFHLMEGSPCIDAGDSLMNVPLCGGSRIDIGAFEKCQENK